MNFFFLALLLVAFSGTKVLPKNEFDLDGALSVEQTRCINGIFVALVLFSHYKNDYLHPGKFDAIYMAAQGHLGQNIVTMFLFYSGFGMMTQYRKKGMAYIWSVPKRFATLLLKFVLAVLLFLVLQTCYGKHYSVERVLLSLIGWSGIGNSNWYVFTMLCIYICFFSGFWLSQRLFKNKSEKPGAALMAFFCFLCLMFQRMAGRPTYCYNTIIAFVMGVFLCMVKEKCRCCIKNDTEYYILLSVLAALYTIATLKSRNRLLWYETWVVLFAVLTVTISMKLTVYSPLLSFLGSHVFSIYILQRIPMIILGRAGFTAAHPYCGLMLVISCTIIVAVLFDWFVGNIFKYAENWTKEILEKTKAVK